MQAEILGNKDKKRTVECYNDASHTKETRPAPLSLSLKPKRSTASTKVRKRGECRGHEM